MSQQISEIENDYKPPLISVIIPCYNQGRFLSKSIESIKEQTYPNIEIIVINDGSTDNTDEVCRSIAGIKYVCQENRGLPGARNRGISESKGKYIAFLDADDWFYPDAMEKNMRVLEDFPSLAFVSGTHSSMSNDGEIYGGDTFEIEQGHYVAMLQRNYIGNPATVLYARWIIDIFSFDTSPKIKGCEDYDHYLKITRSYQVSHHNEKISVYRRHGDNMSDNYAMMLDSVLNTLNRQQPMLRNEEERIAFQQGIIDWKGRYMSRIYINLLSRRFKNISTEEKNVIWKYRKDFLIIFLRHVKSKLWR